MTGSEPIGTPQSAIGNGDSLVTSDAPWPGLAPFTEDQSGFFYGRDEEIRTLARLMERKALTVLFGQSGLGKSSLLQAGVFPRLRAAGFCPIYVRLDYGGVPVAGLGEAGPGSATPATALALPEQVKQTVLAETARVGTWTKAGAANPGESLWEYFHHRDDRLVDGDGRTIVPVLVFDQFEELFTLGARSTGSGPAARSTSPSTGSGSRAEPGDSGLAASSTASGQGQRDRAVAFMSELAELVENRPSEQLVARLDQSTDEMDAFDFSRTDYRVCISLREDYLPHLEGLKTIMPALMENRMRLTRMTGNQALEAVLKPGGALVTEEVARTIVEFVSGARGGSAERLAELDVEPPLLSVICRELNDRRRALGQAQITADLVTGNRREILHDFYERSVADLPEPMRRFVEDKLLTKSGFRDNLALETALEEPGVTKPLIDTLVQRRLLRIEDRIGTQRVELTHDVLADVVRASRDARQQRLALEQAQAREQAALAANARRARRTRYIIGGLATAVVALLVGAFFGVRAQRRAEAAQREASAQSSRTDFIFGSQLLEQDKTPEGLAYLVRAARSDPSNQSVGPRLISELVGRSFAAPIGEPLAQGSPVLRAAYSPDGSRAVTEGRHGTITFWDLVAGNALRRITVNVQQSVIGHGPFDVNPALTAYAFGDSNGVVRVANLETDRPQFPPLQTGSEVESLRYSPDGRWLVSSHADSKLRVWDAHTGELKATIDAGVEAYYFGFDAGSTRIVATSHARGIWRVWQVPGGKPLTDWVKTPNGYANVAAFSPDGNLLAVTDNGGAQLYDATAGTLVGARMAHAGPAYDVAFSHDGKLLVTTSNDATARLWEVPSGAPHLAPLAHGDRTSIATFSRDDRLLLTACADGVARLWDVSTGRLACEPIRVGDILCAALSPDGSEFLTAGVDGVVRRWSTDPGAARALVMSTSRDAVSFAVNSRDTTMGWTISGNRLQQFDLLTGRPMGQPRLLPEAVTVGQLSPDAKRLAVRTAEGAEVWNLQTSPIRRVPLEEPGDAKLRAWITGDSRYLLGLQNAETVRVWDLDTGRLQLRVAHSSRSFAYCAATRRLALNVNGRFVQMYDLVRGVRVGDPMSQPGAVTAVAFTADGRRMACGTGAGLVQLWDATSRQPIGEPLELRGLVRNVQFSDDGRRLLTGTPSETRVWDVATREPLTEPMVGGNDIVLAAFVPGTNSRRITTIARTKNERRIWDAESGELISEPMHRHVAGTDGATFGSAKFMALVARDGIGMHVEMIALPPPAAPVPDWLLQLATTMAGGEIGARGNFHERDFDAKAYDDIRRELAALPDDAPYVEWGRWFLADRATRSIAPGFTITPAEAEKLAAESGPAAAPLTDERRTLKTEGPTPNAER